MAGGKTFIPEIKDQETIDKKLKKHGHALNRSWRTGEHAALRELGIETEREHPTSPVCSGVPSVFLVKDGKVSTLEESGLKLNTAEFSKAILLGQVFAYPAGKTEPVQLQVEQEAHGIDLNAHYSAPLTIDPNDPSPERRKTAEAIRARYGAMRAQTDFQAEAAEMARRRDLYIQQEKEHAYRSAAHANGTRQYGIEIVENVYAPVPVLREDFLGKSLSEGKPYLKQEFDQLTKSEIDLSHISINTDAAITQREFAVLAMFASLEPDVVVEHQQIAAADPAPVITGFQNLGFTEQEAKEILNMSNSGAYTIDVLAGESRNKNNIHAFNAGRKKAAEALTAYKTRSDKVDDESNMEKLAEILSRAVEYAGYSSGSTTDRGAPGLAKLATEAINVMERDPSLRRMAKRMYEKRDGEFCARHPFYRHKNFEEQIRDIRAMDRYADMVQKGRDAETALLGANAGKVELTEEQKKACTRDVVRAGLLEANFTLEVVERETDDMNETRARFQQYVDQLQMQLMEQDEGEEYEEGIQQKNGGSSIPTNTPSVLSGAMHTRLTGTVPTLSNMAKPSWLAQLEAVTEAIAAEDGLDGLSLDALTKKTSEYLHGNNKNKELKARFALLAAQKKAAPPAPKPERPKMEPNPLDKAIPYAPQRTTYTQAERKNDNSYEMENSLNSLQPMLRSLGLYVHPQKPAVPRTDGEPRIFMVKDGKAMTLEEGNILFGDHSFAEAMKLGQIFAFPAGSREAVQLRFDPNAPIEERAGYSKLTDFPRFEPMPEMTKPAPRWYHRLFRFGNNARICDEYEAEQQKLRDWEAKVKETKARTEEMGNAIMAIEARFGASRSQEALDGELADWRETEEKTVRAKLEGVYRVKQKYSRARAVCIEVIENLYAPKPQLREEFVKDMPDGTKNKNAVNPTYDRETFRSLSNTEIDLNQVRLGGKPLTEQEFATVALYAAHDPDVAYLNQNNAVGDPEPIIKDFEKEGYTREDAKEVILTSNYTAYSVDILKGESRIENYVGAINEGRKRAAEALKAYPGDKTKLAEIFSRAVGLTGAPMGVLNNTGAQGYARLGVRAIELMDRDPELRSMAKDVYEKRQRALAERHGEVFRYLSFEDQIKAIRAHDEYGNVQQRGAAGEAKLAKANMEGVPLTPAERQEAIRDILKAKHTDAVFADQRRKGDKPENASEEYKKYQAYATEVVLRHPGGIRVGAKGGGSSLPGSMPTIIHSSPRDNMADKCRIIFDVADPKWAAAMDRTLDKIIEEDGLIKCGEAELLEKLTKGKAYEEEQLIKRAAKAAKELEPKPAPEARPALGKQQEGPEAEAGL